MIWCHAPYIAWDFTTTPRLSLWLRQGILFKAPANVDEIMVHRLTRWYMWLIYLVVTGCLMIVVLFWIDHAVQTADLKNHFTASCYAAGFTTGNSITVRHCECVWDHLRRDYSAWDHLRHDYSVADMRNWSESGRRDHRFEERMDTASLKCR